MKTTTATLRKLKGQRPIVCLTAYDALYVALAAAAQPDVLLVGDSVGTVHLGFTSTVPVTLDMMLHHTAAVARARPEALVVADLPFGWAHREPTAVLEACLRFIQEGGAEAVKIEATAALAPVVERLVAAGVPVLAHIGLLPQRVLALGGYRKFGKTPDERAALLDDARALEAAGAFAVLGEMIEPTVAAELTAACRGPFIGIGCGPQCDGQILVSTDVLGLHFGHYPGFAKKYASLGELASSALAAYAADVRERRFP